MPTSTLLSVVLGTASLFFNHPPRRLKSLRRPAHPGSLPATPRTAHEQYGFGGSPLLPHHPQSPPTAPLPRPRRSPSPGFDNRTPTRLDSVDPCSRMASSRETQKNCSIVAFSSPQLIYLICISLCLMPTQNISLPTVLQFRPFPQSS